MHSGRVFVQLSYNMALHFRMFLLTYFFYDSWLKDWKRRAELEERQNLKGKRDEKEEGILSFWVFF